MYTFSLHDNDHQFSIPNFDFVCQMIHKYHSVSLVINKESCTIERTKFDFLKYLLKDTKENYIVRIIYD